uniref:Cystatin domain-containing protein n=1 Tax=Arion vulgaris TaxID=1028688 RepID=A0A0B7A3F7_9EUPU
MKVLLLLATALPFITCGLLGGQNQYNAQLTDASVIFAVSEINNFFQANGDQRPRVAVQIRSATSQVVSGTKYGYEIEVSGGDTKEICNITIWSQPWLSASEKNKVVGTPSCIPETSVAQPAVSHQRGGQQIVSLTDADVVLAAQFLESTLNAQSNSLFYLKITSASKVTKQIVNGVNYRFFDANLTPTSCTKNDVKLNPDQVCTVNANAVALVTCTYVVYYNPRQTPAYTISSQSCPARN